METTADIATEAKKSSEEETPHKHVTQIISTIAGCALGAFALGALTGAAWPGAVAACGLSVMGVGVAYFMLGRG